MLEYEWGNPSTIMFAGDEPTQDSDQTRQILANFHQESFTGAHHHFSHSTTTASAATADTFSHHLFHNNHSDIHQSFYDPRSNYTSTTSYPPPPPPPAMLTLDPLSGATGGGGGGGGGFMLVPKSEEIGRPGDFTARIGLNLGHRTYFSADDDFVNRLYRRSRTGPLEPGSSTNSPRCQAEGCTADLTNSKHYHRRHKVCEFHSKASTVIAGGLTQRFCQQCSRFHLLSEFDNGKRSCRKRLADHNRRRRKSHQQPNQDRHKSQAGNTTINPSSENLARSPADSGAHSSSSVTVAVSPPPPSSDCFRQSSYLATTASSGSSRSLFYFNE